VTGALPWTLLVELPSADIYSAVEGNSPPIPPVLDALGVSFLSIFGASTLGA